MDPDIKSAAKYIADITMMQMSIIEPIMIDLKSIEISILTRMNMLKGMDVQTMTGVDDGQSAIGRALNIGTLTEVYKKNIEEMEKLKNICKIIKSELIEQYCYCNSCAQNLGIEE